MYLVSRPDEKSKEISGPFGGNVALMRPTQNTAIDDLQWKRRPMKCNGHSDQLIDVQWIF